MAQEPKASTLPVLQQKPTTQLINGVCGQYRTIVEQYDWDVNLILAIMKAESGCKPDSINWSDGHNGCTGSYGLMQLACLHFSEGQDKLDVVTNIAVAYKVYVGSGLTAWSAYTNGSYLKFLNS